MQEPDIEKELEFQKNKNEALKLADMIFKVINTPDILKMDAEKRHKMLIDRYPNFARAYPVVIRFMGLNGRYNRKAFERFLNNLIKNPGKGMDGFITCQAYYAKFLYIEETKKRMGHYSVKHANDIWTMEYDNMKTAVKKIEKKEKEAKNEYKEESKKNLEVLKKELLDFVETQGSIELSDDEDDKPPELSDDVSKFNGKDDNLDVESVLDVGEVGESKARSENKKENIMEVYTQLLEREYELIDLIHEKNRMIENLETQNNIIMKKKMIDDRNDWLKGTVLDRKKKKTK